MRKIAIVTPVFNDWESLKHLVYYLDKQGDLLKCNLELFVIDDGSVDLLTKPSLLLSGLSAIKQITITALVCNLGHQRAIAVGLCEVSKRADIDAVIVMDSDGEDKPDDIEKLLAAHYDFPNQIVVAQRGKRTEPLKFRLFYATYKVLFYLLTGKVIDFGNFCLIPRPTLFRLSHMPDLWNNLAATITRSKMPIFKVRTNRGKRYAGRSKMNVVSLILHGLTAISVYSDVVFVRGILFFSVLALCLVVGIAMVITVRLFTDLAVPGWATYVIGLLSILLLQSLLFTAGAAFSLLNGRSAFSIVPSLDSQRYIREQFIIS